MYPLLAVSQALLARGHAVAMLTATAYRELVTSAGVTYVPPREAPDRDYNRLSSSDPHLRLLPNVEVLARLFGDRAVQDAAAQAHDLGAVAARWLPDLLVNDGIALGVPLAAGLLGLPWATVSPFIFCTIPAPDLPPPFLGMRYSATPGGRAAVTGASRLAELRLAAASHRWRALAHAWHVPHPPASVRLAGSSPLLYLFPGGSPLEYPRRAPPPEAHSVGPLVFDSGGVEELPAVSRPRVFVTEGTTHTDSRLARLAATALADLPVEVLITAGRRDVPTTSARFPANVRVVSYVRYSAALAGAALLVTNGGAGSLIAALSGGVPSLILPAGLDKGEAAERVAWAGAGLRLPAAPSCSVGRFRDAAIALLNEPRYRRRARAVGLGLLELGGPARAAALLEQVALVH